MAFTPIDEEEIINEPVAEEAKPRFIPIEDDEFFGIVGEEEAPEPTSPLGAPAPAEAPKSRFTPISDDEFFGIETPKEEPQQPSDWDTLRGAEVALRQVPQLAYGVAGLVGATSEQITGYGEALRDFGFRGYKEWEESMEPISKETDDITVAWDRAKEGDVGALVDWAQYGVGYALGQLGETAAVAVLGGLAGAATGAPAGGVGAVPAAAGGAIAAAATKQGFKALARDLVEKAIANQATKIVTRQAAKEGIELTAEQLAKRASQDAIKRQAGKEIGSNVAVFGNAIGMQLGSIYGEAESKAQSEGRDLTGYDLARVWGTGIATGGLEGVVDKLGLDLLKGKLSGALPEGRLAGAAVAGGVGTLGEAATEGIQTVGERFGAGKDILGDEALNEYINAAALGGLGGGVIGGAGGFVSGNPKENAAAKAKVSAEASKNIAPESSKLVSDQADAVINEVAQEPPEQRVARLQREAQEGVDIDLEEEPPVSGLPPERIKSARWFESASRNRLKELQDKDDAGVEDFTTQERDEFEFLKASPTPEQIAQRYGYQVRRDVTPTTVTPAEPAAAPTPAESLLTRKSELDAEAKRLGADNISSFNSMYATRESLTEEQRNLLNQYGEYNKQVVELGWRDAAKLDDADFGRWEKIKLTTKPVSDQELTDLGKLYLAFNERGETQKAESVLKSIQSSKRKTNNTIDDWFKATDETLSQQEIDTINRENQEWNDSVDSMNEILGRKTPPEEISPTDIAPTLTPTPAAGVAGTTASVPVMITRKMEADLLSRGLTQEQINAMTPQEANDMLAQPVPTAAPIEPVVPVAGVVEPTVTEVAPEAVQAAEQKATQDFAQDLYGQEPYINHLRRVSEQMPNDKLKTAAFIHDSVEDGKMTLDEVRSQFGGGVAELVDVVSRKEDETYAQFIDRIAQNPEAAQIKLADLRENIRNVEDFKPSLRSRYEKAIAVLEPVVAQVAPTPEVPTAVEPPALAPLRRVVKAEQTEEDVSGLVGQGLVELYNGQPVITQAGLEALPEAERPRLTPEARKIQIDTRTSEAAAEAISKNLRIGVDQVPPDVRMPAGWTLVGDIYIPPVVEAAPEVAPEAAPEIEAAPEEPKADPINVFKGNVRDAGFKYLTYSDLRKEGRAQDWEKEGGVTIDGSYYPTAVIGETKVAFTTSGLYVFKNQVRELYESDVDANGNTIFTIQRIVTPEDKRGQGSASKALSQITDAADKAGLTLQLQPAVISTLVGKGGELSAKQLVDWYKRNGFTQKFEGSDAVLIRSPKPTAPAIPEVVPPRQPDTEPQAAADQEIQSIVEKYQTSEPTARMILGNINFDANEAGVIPDGWTVETIDGRKTALSPVFQKTRRDIQVAIRKFTALERGALSARLFREGWINEDQSKEYLRNAIQRSSQERVTAAEAEASERFDALVERVVGENRANISSVVGEVSKPTIDLEAEEQARAEKPSVSPSEVLDPNEIEFMSARQALKKLAESNVISFSDSGASGKARWRYVGKMEKPQYVRLQEAASILAKTNLRALDAERINISGAGGRANREYAGNIFIPRTEGSDRSIAYLEPWVLLHEVGHTLTSDAFQKHVPDKGLTGADYYKQLKDTLKNKKVPRQVKRAITLYIDTIKALGFEKEYFKKGGLASNNADRGLRNAAARTANKLINPFTGNEITRDDMYALADMHEFYAQAWNSESFQDILKQIKVEPQKSAFQKFVDIIKDILGFESDTMAYAVIDTSLRLASLESPTDSGATVEDRIKTQKEFRAVKELPRTKMSWMNFGSGKYGGGRVKMSRNKFVKLGYDMAHFTITKGSKGLFGGGGNQWSVRVFIEEFYSKGKKANQLLPQTEIFVRTFDSKATAEEFAERLASDVNGMVNEKYGSLKKGAPQPPTRGKPAPRPRFAPPAPQPEAREDVRYNPLGYDITNVVEDIKAGRTDGPLRAVNNVVKEATALRDRVKAEADRRQRPRARGKASILERIARERSSGKISEETAQALTDFVNSIREEAIGDTAISIKGAGAASNFDFGQSLVTFFLTQDQPKVGARVGIHEFWHGLSRFLPKTEAEKMAKDYTQALSGYLKDNPWFLAFVGRYSLTPEQFEEYKLFNPKEAETKLVPVQDSQGNIVKYQIKYDAENYRYIMLDEWIAEKMTDLVESRQAMPNTFIGKLAKIIKEFLAQIQAKLGRDAYQSFYNLVTDPNQKIDLQRMSGVARPFQIYQPQDYNYAEDISDQIRYAMRQREDINQEYTPNTDEERKAFEKATSNKVLARNPQLAVAAVRLKNGQITAGEYADLVDSIDPFVPKGADPIPTDEKIKQYIQSDKVGKVGLLDENGNPRLQDGSEYEFRIDINTYNRSTAAGDTVYNITAHESVPETSKRVGEAYAYVGVAKVTNPTFMTRAISGKGSSVEIAAGKGKFPLATVKGSYEPITELPADINDPNVWTEVGYNPVRSSFFVDTRSKQAVVGGSEAIMVGSRVFVKNAQLEARPTGITYGKAYNPLGLDPEPTPSFAIDTPEAKTLSNLKASMEKVDGASEAKGGKPETQKVSEIAANWMESGGDERALQDAIIENTNLSPVNAAKVAKVIAKQYDIQQSIATAFLETQMGLSVEALPEGVTLPKEVDPDRPKPVMSRLFEVFMGVRVPPVKIQVNEKAALKDQIRLKAAANRAAKAEQKRTAEEVVEIIKAMELLGPVRPKQVQAMAKRAARVIWTSEKSVEVFSEYAAKVVENANYDADLREAKDAQKRAKQLSTQKKVAMSPQREVLEDVSKVPVNKLDDPRMFAEAVNYYLRGFKAVLSPDYVVIPDAEMESYLSGAQSETQRNQRDLDREANERLARKYGIEPDQVNEMMESIDIIKQIEAQENREALENLLTEKAIETQQGLRGYDTDNLRADQRSIVSSMLKVDPKALDPEERQRFIRITNNIIYNNQTNGAEYFVAVAKGQQSAREAAQDSTMVAKNRAWINLLPRFVSERMQRGWALELQSIADTFRNAFGKGAMAQVYDLMGMLDLNLGFTKANNTINEIQKKIADFHRGLEKKYKEAARNQDGLLAEGIVGFLIQSIPKKDEVTSINQRRDLIRQDIANRRRSTAQPDRVAMADRIETILNRIDGESVESVLNNMKREFPANHESLIWYKDTLLPQYKDFLKNFDENFNDQANNYDNPNYLTIGFTSAGPSLAITPEEQSLFYNQVSLNPKQSAYTIKRVDYSKLPKGKEIEFNLRRNVFNGLSDQINKAYTSSAWQRIASFMKTPEAEAVFGGAANKDFFIERLNRLRLSRMRRGSMGSGGAIEKAVDSLSVISRKLGTGIALGGIYQWIKQPPDQLITAWGSGGRGDLLAKNIAPSTQKAARELLNKFSIGRRGDASAGYKYINQMEGHQNRLERYFSESKWDQAKEQAGKIADVWMVALKSSDFLAASAAWMTYYEGELNKKDIKIDDWSKEAALIESDPARRQAAAFAEQMTDIYQGSSDPTSMATFAQSGKTGWENLVKAIFVPFNSFAIQQRMRLYSDAVDAINGNKSGVGGLAGTIGGLILFHTTKRYVIPAISGLGAGILYGLMGVDMDEPDEEKQKEEANKNWRQFLADLTGNLLVGGTPQLVETQFIDAMNRASYLVSLQLENDSILNDKGEIMSYDQYSKERSPFYRYKSYDNAMSLGMLDIGMGQVEQVALQTKMLASPEEMEMYTPEEQRLLYFSALSEWLLLMRLNDTDFARLVSKARRDMINAAKEREKYIKAIRSGR